MKTYTNMTWPDDPYRTGQQLYRRPAPRLVAFTVDQATEVNFGWPRAFAIVYLPLHRTQAMTVTEQRLAFGFRAAGIDGGTEASGMAELADLDLMQARRHAAFLTGYRLTDDLIALQNSAHDDVLRGVAAVTKEWADRHAPSQGRASMFDCGLDFPNAASLEEACERSGVSLPTMGCCAQQNTPAGGEHVAAGAVERALTIALISARYLDRYMWEGTLQTEALMAANAWDCFPGRLTDHETSVQDSRLG
jgi:hypothetical protein